MERIYCLLIGYGFGCILTAEIVVKKWTGKRPKDIGSGNPGMANVMDQVGIRAGLLVLVGDLSKTLMACLIGTWLFGDKIGNIAGMYTGIGAMLGHNYPIWNHFRGGKGVAVTCLFSTFYLPLWGLLCSVAGALAVLATGYLSVGGVLIPILYLIPAFLFGGIEAGLLAVFSAMIMLLRHASNLSQMIHGEGKKVFLLRKKS